MYLNLCFDIVKIVFRLVCCFLLLFWKMDAFAQNKELNQKNQIFIIPELLVGETMEANTDFPESKLQKGVFLSLGTTSNSEKEWSRILGFPRVGFTIGFTDFGNSKNIGYAYTLMSFVEFDLLKKKNLLSLNVGMGGAYIDTKYDPELNPFNLAVTTDVNWAFRSFVYYNVYASKIINWRLGLGYAHFSNGHTRLPNQGLNSFLLSISSSIYPHRNTNTSEELKTEAINYSDSSSEVFLETRFGIGQNVLSRVYNDKKEVFSVAISGGKIINSTFKFSFGGYYRFYEQYYDHIVNEGRLINEQVPHFKEKPYRYATNFGLFVGAELLMGHFGTELNLGANLYKPFYEIDWQLSQGFYANGDYVKLGELNSYYKTKKTISSRLGIRYYILNTSNHPKNNFFIAAHINANLGQADFSEFSVGYICQLNYRMKK